MPLLTVGNPWSASAGQMTIMAGDDYKAADGRAAIFTNTAGANTWPNLTSASVYFVAQNGNFPPQQPSTVPVAMLFPAALINPVLGTVVTPTGASQQVRFDIPASSTNIRPTQSANDLYSFAVFAILSNGDIVTLITGPLEVLGVS